MEQPSAVFEERRRAPRLEVHATPPAVPPHVVLPWTLPIDVIDISEAGLLVHSSSPMEPSRRCRLKLLLGQDPLVAEVTVRRCSPWSGGGFRIAAVFTSMSEDSRRALDRLLHERRA